MAKSEGTPDTKNLPYISCIRIHGLKILPPILSEEKRHKMQYYKELAMQVEQKIKNRKRMGPCTDSTDDCRSYTSSSTSTISESSSYSSDEEQTFKSQIFSESCRSDVLKMLNDSPKISNVPLKESDTNKCLIKNVDLPEKMTPNKEIISVDQISAENDTSSCYSPNGAGDNVKDNLDENKNETIEHKSPPLLIRSNSYTLDSPSPFLLALMQQNEIYIPAEAKESSTSKKRRTWDLQNAREKWTSIEHDLNVVADKTSGHKLDHFNSLPPSTHTSPETKMFASRIEHFKNSLRPEKDSDMPTKQIKERITIPEKSAERFVKSFVTPSRSQIIKQPKRLTPKKTDISLRKSEIIIPKKPEILDEKSEKNIREIIDKIHTEQSKQMSDLIAKQKKEQETLMKVFAEQQALVLSKLKNTYQAEEDKKEEAPNQNEISPIPDILKNSENLLSECKKLLQQEVISQSETISNLDDTITDISLKSCSPSPEFSNPSNLIITSSRFSNSYSIDSLEPICNGSAIKRRNSTCSRQLFPTKQQMWAANIINAGVRGYLIRRLIKTERVQNLIKTIRDTLVLAMQLHHETAEKIQPADVELHRRLIQQVTAACYTFHDTFFELPKSEQLQIIATDRDRQKDKLSRPLSAKSNTSLSITTQKVLERKMRRRSSESASRPQSRSSSSRSNFSNSDFRVRPKSVGLSDSEQNSNKTSPQNDVMRHAMSYGANKKPWR